MSEVRRMSFKLSVIYVGAAVIAWELLHAPEEWLWERVAGGTVPNLLVMLGIVTVHVWLVLLLGLIVAGLLIIIDKVVSDD